MNRSQRNKDVTTASMFLFSGKEILTKRPEYMPYQDFKAIRKQQTRALKRLHASKPDRRISQLMPTRIGYNLH